MSEECNYQCEGCSKANNCEDVFKKSECAKGVHIKHKIGIISGKGGVGKSFTTSMIAVALARQGFKVGILDADITGPSIPQAFNINSMALSDGTLIIPAESNKFKIKIISSNMLLEDKDQPIIWRGTLLGNLVKQFYSETNWGEELDYLLIDMPPGTGDIALTTFQSLPIDGIIVVTTPQSLVSMIVKKAINMANEMNIEVFGVIENMSYVECKCCNEKNYIFGHSHTKEILDKFGVDLLGEVPLKEESTLKVDEGHVEDLDIKEFNEIANKIIKKTKGE